MSETKKVITVVDKASKALTKASTDLTKTMSDLSALAEQSATLMFDIEMKSSELQQLDDAYKAKEREAQADLAIRVKENEHKVLTGLQEKFNLAQIKSDDLQALEAKVTSLESEQAKAIEAAVTDSASKLHASYGAKLSQQKAEHQVAVADMTADNKALRSEIEYLKNTNAVLRKMIDEEREARVEVARNQSQPVVNVSSAK